MKIIVLGIILLTLLAGCSQNTSQDKPAKITANQTQKQLVSDIEPLPEFKKPAKVSYQGHAYKNPFKNKINNSQLPLKITEKQDVSKRKNPLLQFPLASLQMAGTINLNGNIWAIIRTPDNQFHPVKTGQLVGENQDRIIKITKQKIDIKEKVFKNGKTQSVIKTLTLPEYFRENHLQFKPEKLP